MKVVAFLVELIVFMLVLSLLTTLPTYWKHPMLILVVIVVMLGVMVATILS